MLQRLVIFPLIRRGDWIFRTSISDSKRIMLMAFGPDSQFLMRFYLDEELAQAFVEEATSGKHAD